MTERLAAHNIIIVVPTWIVWLAFVVFLVSAIATGADAYLRWQLIKVTKAAEARKREMQDIRARSI